MKEVNDKKREEARIALADDIAEIKRKILEISATKHSLRVDELKKKFDEKKKAMKKLQKDIRKMKDNFERMEKKGEKVEEEITDSGMNEGTIGTIVGVSGFVLAVISAVSVYRM